MSDRTTHRGTTRAPARALAAVGLLLTLPWAAAPWAATPPSATLVLDHPFALEGDGWTSDDPGWTIGDGLLRYRSEARSRLAVRLAPPPLGSDPLDRDPLGSDPTVVELALRLVPEPADDPLREIEARWASGAGIVFGHQGDGDFSLFRLAGREGAVVGRREGGEWLVPDPCAVRLADLLPTADPAGDDGWRVLRLELRDGAAVASIDGVAVCRVDAPAAGRVGVAAFKADVDFAVALAVVAPAASASVSAAAPDVLAAQARDLADRAAELAAGYQAPRFCPEAWAPVSEAVELLLATPVPGRLAFRRRSAYETALAAGEERLATAAASCATAVRARYQAALQAARDLAETVRGLTERTDVPPGLVAGLLALGGRAEGLLRGASSEAAESGAATVELEAAAAGLASDLAGLDPCESRLRPAIARLDLVDAATSFDELCRIAEAGCLLDVHAVAARTALAALVPAGAELERRRRDLGSEAFERQLESLATLPPDRLEACLPGARERLFGP